MRKEASDNDVFNYVAAWGKEGSGDDVFNYVAGWGKEASDNDVFNYVAGWRKKPVLMTCHSFSRRGTNESLCNDVSF